MTRLLSRRPQINNDKLYLHLRLETVGLPQLSELDETIMTGDYLLVVTFPDLAGGEM